jgi:transposase, IS30 family
MKKKTFKRLSYKERVLIENRYCVDYKSKKAIARELKRPVSTISREIAGKPRKGRGKYNADIAQRVSDEKRGNQGRDGKLESNKQLQEYVIEKLTLGWSPEQISIRLKIEFTDDKTMRISYEAIYQYIYNQHHRGGNGTLKNGCVDLRQCLPRRHKRRATKGARKAQKMERESMLPSIEKRPSIVDKKKRIGDWEDDTLVSRQSAARIKSVSERKSGIVFFAKTKDGTVASCDEVLRKRLEALPQEYRLTLTRDRGSENMGYEELSKELGMKVFFAHPYCSYERGGNENDNGLFRRYYPKKTDFATLTNEEIVAVEYLINSRPRKRLGGLTPYEVFYQETGVALEV